MTIKNGDAALFSCDPNQKGLRPHFSSAVATKFQVYNSLFLGLPFDTTNSTGVHLPLLLVQCREGLAKGVHPNEILERFFRESFANLTQPEQKTILFNLIQYVERQVVLFDAVEDSAFEQLNDLDGEGTIANLEKRLRYRDRAKNFIEKIQDFSLLVVLTAHPTQFYPSTVLSIINSLDQAIRLNNLDEINDLLIQLGKTPFLKKEKPTPYDEAVSLIWYLENVFYDAVSSIAAQVKQLLATLGAQLDNKRLIRIGFWPGGDRDGNPTVTSETTRQVIGELKRALFRKYYQDILRLRQKFTFNYTHELLQAIEERLYLGLYQPEQSYSSAEQLLLDMTAVKNSILQFHSGLFIDQIDAFIMKVELFGIHFSMLDIRQDSRIHSAVFDKVLGHYAPQLLEAKSEAASSDSARIQKLYELNLKVEPEDFEANSIEKETLQSFRDMRWAQTQNGSDSCKRYIISNCRSTLDVIKILLLASWTTWHEQPAELDVIPLFESIEDLKKAPTIMQELFDNQYYRKHLAARGLLQTVMLGFSDGTKDGGYMTANWCIYEAKENLSRVARKAGIKLVFFDGRGGPPARGGGNTNKFYSSLGSSIEHHEIQLTIQGQTISSNFGTVAAAKFNLEQLLTAGIESDVFFGDIAELSAEQKQLIIEISDLSLKAYRELKSDPQFLNYLQQLGTLDYYGLTNISSRPTKRNTDKLLTLSDLRAIPFVGTWTQMKQNVPGYYGLGSALAEFQKLNRLAEVSDLYQQSAFFRTLIDNSMQVLLKTNFQLTQHFAKHPTFGPLWNKIRDEFELTQKFVLQISKSNELMESNPNTRASIAMREQIVLPLLVIQQAALSRLQATQSEEDQDDAAEVKDLRNLVLRSMFGIINAGRNSV